MTLEQSIMQSDSSDSAVSNLANYSSSAPTVRSPSFDRQQLAHTNGETGSSPSLQNQAAHSHGLCANSGGAENGNSHSIEHLLLGMPTARDPTTFSSREGSPSPAPRGPRPKGSLELSAELENLIRRGQVKLRGYASWRPKTAASSIRPASNAHPSSSRHHARPIHHQAPTAQQRVQPPEQPTTTTTNNNNNAVAANAGHLHPAPTQPDDSPPPART